MDKLEPCPFCQKQPVKVPDSPLVECRTEGCAIEHIEAMPETWNRRAPSGGVSGRYALADGLDGGRVIWSGLGGPVAEIAVQHGRIYGRWDAGCLWFLLGYIPVDDGPSAPKAELRGPAAQGESYHRGYTQGMSDALQNMPKMMAAFRNPPPILVDASGIDPKILESLKARSAPERSEGPQPPAASAGAAPTKGDGHG